MGMRYKMKWLDVPLLSQSNTSYWDGVTHKNDHNNDWCGRTSACMIYNYYQNVKKSNALIVNNREDSGKPYELIYPDGTVAARGGTGSYLIDEPLEKAAPGWIRLELFPKNNERPSPVSDEIILAKLDPVFNSIDNNNPVLFYSGISEGTGGLDGREPYPRHIVVISGYDARADGSLWLQISDPATMHTKRKYLDSTEKNVEVKENETGVWGAVGCRYWLRARRLFEPNEHSVGGKLHKKDNNNPEEYVDTEFENDLWCDHCDRPGFTVFINGKAQTPDTCAHAVGRGVSLPLADHSLVTKESIRDYYFFTEKLYKGGYFPLGANSVWHGGLHLHTKIGSVVVACADGEVVAARLPDDEKKASAHFGSLNFILLKHELTEEVLRNASFVERKIIGYKIKQGVDYVVRKGDYLRGSPKDSKNNRIQGLQLKKEDAVTVTDTSEKKGWWKVRTEEGQGGYVKSDGMTLDLPFNARVGHGVNIRQAPNGTVVERVAAADTVEVLQQDGDWWKIRKTSKGEARGYVRASVAGLTPVKSEVPFAAKVKAPQLDVYSRPEETTPLEDNKVDQTPLEEKEVVRLAPPECKEAGWRHVRRLKNNEEGYFRADRLDERPMTIYREKNGQSKIGELMAGDEVKVNDPDAERDGDWVEVTVTKAGKHSAAEGTRGWILHNPDRCEEVTKPDEDHINKMKGKTFYSLYMHLNNEKLEVQNHSHKEKEEDGCNRTLEKFPWIQTPPTSRVKNKTKLHVGANTTRPNKTKTLKKNEAVVVLDTSDSDWWRVRTEGGTGDEYVKQFQLQLNLPVKAEAKYGCKVHSQRNKDSQTVARLSEGEVITLVETSADGWWKVQRDGETHPKGYVGYQALSLLPPDDGSELGAKVRTNHADVHSSPRDQDPNIDDLMVDENGSPVEIDANQTVIVMSDYSRPKKRWMVETPDGKKKGWVDNADLADPTIWDMDLIKQLRGGKVVKIEGKRVKSGDPLWTSGDYGSVQYRSEMIHWEIFSPENFFAKWEQYEDTDGEFNVDCKSILNIIREHWFGADTILTPNEVADFYRHHKDAVKHRKYACKFTPEWAIDLDVTIPKMEGRWRTKGLKERLSPYMWWEEAARNKVALPPDKRVWHYNPVAFVEALSPAE